MSFLHLVLTLASIRGAISAAVPQKKHIVTIAILMLIMLSNAAPTMLSVNTGSWP
jgi:hypothetical protein